MLKFLTSWKFLGVGVVIAIVAIGYLKLKLDAYEVEVEKLSSQVVTLEQDKQSLTKQMAQYEKDIIAQINKNNRLEEQINIIDRERRNAINELESTKGRQELVWQRPELVQRFFRRNWQQRTDEISCVMGVTEKCD